MGHINNKPKQHRGKMSEGTKTEGVAEPEAAPTIGKAYLVTYNGEYQDVTVEAFSTKELAVDASGKSPKEKALIVQNVSDLDQYDLKQLVDIYNGINGSNLTRFRTLESGKDRILTSIRGLAEAESAAADDSTNQGEEKVAKTATKKKAVKPAGERKKRKSAVDPDKKIRHSDKFKDYKLREGTTRAKDYARMTNGAKVATYLEKGSAGNLRFALKSKHITLE